ncbi:MULTISPECIES: hypothetical protein [unclassified Streptomyces]|uniref:hypothetical protein n=1 Tax=unclassified Streptomyces TaxID=2593676 RepID=UPI0004CAD765|nr:MULTISPECIES: hypothetical protein [unclassified Streptomyces]KOX44065.1 membrane protein [Streptomyces sp. NRRL F-7442]
MSRETDSSSSGPHGRGGAAYPSGTPPYGTPAASDAGADAGRSATRPEERKTETTLTTRIRINIPGSRPIPPVVVRKPVTDGEEAAGSAEATTTGERPAPAPSAAAPASPPEAPAEPAQPAQPAEEKPTSDWFAPRKSGQGKGTQGGGSTNGAGLPGGSAAPAAGQGASGAPGGRGAAPAGAGAPGAGARPGGGSGRPGGVVGSMNAPGGSRPGSAGGAARSGATGGPVAPGHGGGTGSFDVTEALAAGPLGSNGNGNGSSNGNGARPGPGTGGTPGHADRPGFDQPDFTGQGRTDQGPGAPGGQHNGLNGQSPYGVGPQGPAGPTSGPATGDSRLTPPPVGDLGGLGLSGGPGAPAGQSASAPNGLRGPGGPTGAGGPGPGPDASRPGPGGGLSDDTAILTPQRPASPGTGNPDNVSGNTVTSGIPVVPGERSDPFRAAPGDGPLPHTPPKLPEPVSTPPAGSAEPARKKGRRKLPLLVGGLVVVAGVAYGAGLLMNRSDVPKGTTVLGVDIGGGTRDDAVEKLDKALGARAAKPLKLTVGGDTVSLKPDQAGLQLDTQATASDAATSDYNPVSVIGSLFGQKRVVEPVMPVDEEKLHAALEGAAGGAGSATEGTIRFESGRAVPVYGKAGQGIDVAKSTEAVQSAYRAQVETGTATAVSVPTTTKQPTVSKAEVDRMMKEYAEPAMSARVTVQTDAAHSVPLSPEKSLWKFLRVTAVDGKLVDKPDLNALKELYGQTFDGVLITRANGDKTPVTPQDVYGAMRQALKSKTDRVAVIDTNPS